MPDRNRILPKPSTYATTTTSTTTSIANPLCRLTSNVDVLVHVVVDALWLDACRSPHASGSLPTAIDTPSERSLI